MTTTIDATITSPGCNSYIDVTGADAYFADQLYADLWASTGATKKAQALLMAARILDTRVKWAGTRLTQTQPMAWPRAYVLDPDFSFTDPLRDVEQQQYLPTDAWPKFLMEAQCEQALALLQGDTTKDPDTLGYRDIRIGQIAVTLDTAPVSRVLPRPVRDLVAPYGEALDSQAARVVKLVRT